MANADLHYSKPKKTALSFVSYLVVGMWFLLTILSSAHVRAETVTTAANIVRASDILPDIEAALSARGMPSGADIQLNNPDQQIYIKDNASIGHISYNPLSGRFVIRLSESADAISGTARLAASFPVLTRTISRGEIIAETDISYLETSDMRAGYFIQDATALIGKEARRPLQAQTPLRPTDVIAPVLVKKGALVTLTYYIEGLKLTHQGVAMTSGADGDIISVENIQSERTLKGVITGRNLVRIAAPNTAYPIEGS